MATIASTTSAAETFGESVATGVFYAVIGWVLGLIIPIPIFDTLILVPAGFLYGTVVR